MPPIPEEVKQFGRAHLPRSLLDGGHLIAFLCRQRFCKPRIPDKPALDVEGYRYFATRMPRARNYLEYGSGGSTIVAAKYRVRFKSVDSDPFFLRAVENKITAEFGSPNGDFIYCNIGMTELWGFPIFKRLSSSRRKRWKRYALAPWLNQDASFLPDLVLIDGRFRVACALTTIKYLTNKVPFEILVDDYGDRAGYREIEKYAELSSMQGRMAVFNPKSSVNLDDIDRAIETYSLDYH
ncbi:MAG TPA: hypothetical protein VIY68_01480 [Steroidobacteraceae bacterium]